MTRHPPLNHEAPPPPRIDGGVLLRHRPHSRNAGQPGPHRRGRDPVDHPGDAAPPLAVLRLAAGGAVDIDDCRDRACGNCHRARRRAEWTATFLGAVLVFAGIVAGCFLF